MFSNLTIHLILLFGFYTCIIAPIRRAIRRGDCAPYTYNGITYTNIDFFTAIRRGDREDIEKWLKNDSGLINRKKEGTTPLYEAVSRWGVDDDDIRVVKNPCGKTKDPNDPDLPPPQFLTGLCDSDLVDLLLKKGASADVNTKNSRGLTPLHIAAKNGMYEVVELLLKNGAEVNALGYKGNTPLHSAAYQGQKGTVLLLLKNGANVNAKNELGHTPRSLALAQFFRDEEMAKLLEEHGGKL